jgi:hypothetical protein
VVDACLARGANLSRILSAHPVEAGLDAHQINCTYYSALGSDADLYLAARAIQFFAPGVPQVYYVGLLAGENDQASVQATGEGRSINRHNYSMAEVDEALQKPVVRRLLRLIRFRNDYPAFDGDFQVLDATERQVRLAWQKGDRTCRLEVDLSAGQATVWYLDDTGRETEYRV